jgi:hypothetical protein
VRLAGLTVVALCAVLAAAAAAATVVRYSGSGNRTIATVKLSSDTVVRWTATGGSFSMTSGRLKVSGKAKSGQSFATRGTFRHVVVHAKGRWTVSFTPLPAPHR